MGEVAVLHPQSVLKDRLPRDHLFYSAMKIRRESKPNVNPKPSIPRSNRKKRSQTRFQKEDNKTAAPAPTVSAPVRSNLVMGQVKILKRGEVLNDTTAVRASEEAKENSSNSPNFVDLLLSSTDRLGPEPESLPRQIKPAGLYAGSMFIYSPPPSSLPLPRFLKKRSLLTDKIDAANDLRRILGLDFA